MGRKLKVTSSIKEIWLFPLFSICGAGTRSILELEDPHCWAGGGRDTKSNV